MTLADVDQNRLSSSSRQIKRQARVGGEKNEKIGERSLKQEVSWRRLMKFRENWRSFEMLK